MGHLFHHRSSPRTPSKFRPKHCQTDISYTTPFTPHKLDFVKSSPTQTHIPHIPQCSSPTCFGRSRELHPPPRVRQQRPSSPDQLSVASLPLPSVGMTSPTTPNSTSTTSTRPQASVELSCTRVNSHERTTPFVSNTPKRRIFPARKLSTRHHSRYKLTLPQTARTRPRWLPFPPNAGFLQLGG